MNAQVRPTRFIAAWLVAGLFFWPAILAVAAITAVPLAIAFRILDLLPLPDTLFELLYFIILTPLLASFGWTIGAIQSLVTKRYLRVELHRWRAVSALGGLVAFIPAAFLCIKGCAGDEIGYLWTQPSLRPADDMLWAMLVYVGILSVAQFLMLRRQARAASLWIVAHVVSVPMSYALWRNPLAIQNPQIESWLILALAGPIVAALFTGTVMLRIVLITLPAGKSKRKPLGKRVADGMPFLS